VRSRRVLVVDVAARVVEYTILSAACQMRAKSPEAADYAAAAGSVSHPTISSYMRRPCR
jgi:hypothetical protein